MTSNLLHDAIRERPFRPFTLHLTDGRHIDVLQPELIAYTGGQMAVVTQPDERLNAVDLLLVTDLEPKPASAATPPDAGS